MQPHAPRRSRRRLAALALGAALAAPAAAAEPAAPCDLPAAQAPFVTPLALRHGDGEDAPSTPALLTLPPRWAPGDAAAVLATDEPFAHRAHRGAADALLAQGAAVLALDLDAARGLSPDSAAAPPPAAPGDLLAELFGALALLRGPAGAGLVLAVGTGAAGDAALLALEPEEAARHLPPGAAGFAAAAALGPGPAAFAAGAAPAPEEGWARRAPPLCAALAEAAAALEAPGSARRAAADCAAALLGPRAVAAAPVVRTGAPPPAGR